jgi:hypothetical protein
LSGDGDEQNGGCQKHVSRPEKNDDEGNNRYVFEKLLHGLTAV